MELSGRKIICGGGDELKLKYEKYFYLIKLRAILNEFDSCMETKGNKSTTDLCKKCGKPIYNKVPFSKYYSTYCHECKIYGLFNEPNSRFDRVYRDDTDFHNQEILGDILYNFEDQQVDGYYEDHDRSIDYYHQPIYDDRGLHILRPPLRSQELNVNLSTGEFMDEEDIPRRERFFSKPDLRYRRRKYLNGIRVNKTDRVWTTLTRNIVVDDDEIPTII